MYTKCSNTPFPCIQCLFWIFVFSQKNRTDRQDTPGKICIPDIPQMLLHRSLRYPDISSIAKSVNEYRDSPRKPIKPATLSPPLLSSRDKDPPKANLTY